jgi:hypothetical protein
MRTIICIAAAALLASGGVLVAQDDDDTPGDSSLVTIRGCARGSTFTVGPRAEDQPGTLDIEPGRRFRLTGQKKLTDEIKRNERSVIEVTGLIRKSDVAPRGIPVFGGRVRIGGARPQDPISDPARDPAYTQPILDVRSWRLLEGECRAR